MTLRISPSLSLDTDEIEFSAIRAQGSGGQNVNKVASAIHLRFDIRASSLPEEIKLRLLQNTDQRITKEGCIIIKAQRHRSQEKNRVEAIERLAAMIREAEYVPTKRRPTRPSYGARQRRMDNKAHRGKIKLLRGKPE